MDFFRRGGVVVVAFSRKGEKKKKKKFFVLRSSRRIDSSIFRILYTIRFFLYSFFFFFSSSITFDIFVRNIYNCCIRQKLKFYQENRNNRTTFYDIFYNFIRWFILARIYLILLCNNSIVPYFEQCVLLIESRVSDMRAAYGYRF